MRHCYYGDLQGSFEGRGWEFFKRGWWIWLLAITTLLVMFLLVPLAQWYPALLPVAKLISGAGLLIPIVAPFLYGVFKAMHWRWWISGVRFGEVRLQSTLKRGALVGLYWKVIGWFLLMVALFAGYLFACAAAVAGINQTPLAKLASTSSALLGSIPMIVLGVIGYLVFVLALNVVIRVYLVRDLWVRVIDLDRCAGDRGRGKRFRNRRSGQCAWRGFCRWTGCRRILAHEH